VHPSALHLHGGIPSLSASLVSQIAAALRGATPNDSEQLKNPGRLSTSKPAEPLQPSNCPGAAVDHNDVGVLGMVV
jgi:hypothetical protein